MTGLAELLLVAKTIVEIVSVCLDEDREPTPEEMERVVSLRKQAESRFNKLQ